MFVFILDQKLKLRYVFSTDIEDLKTNSSEDYITVDLGKKKKETGNIAYGTVMTPSPAEEVRIGLLIHSRVLSRALKTFTLLYFFSYSILDSVFWQF